MDQRWIVVLRPLPVLIVVPTDRDARDRRRAAAWALVRRAWTAAAGLLRRIRLGLGARLPEAATLARVPAVLLGRIRR